MRTIRPSVEKIVNLYTVKSDGVTVRVVEASSFQEAESLFMRWVKEARPKLREARAHTISFISLAKDVIR